MRIPAQAAGGTVDSVDCWVELRATDAEGRPIFHSGGVADGGARRWVIYNGENEASRVAPDWHGWLHHTYEKPPTMAALPHKPWEKPHVENLTGTDMAYVPKGSLRAAKPAVRTDYEAWQPE